MKFLMLISNQDLKNPADGITKKINWQREGFFNLGLTGKIIYAINKNWYIGSLDRNCDCEGSFIEKIDSKIKELTKYTLLYSHLRRDFDNLHCLYIRYDRSNNNFIRFLRKLKSDNPKLKIILEIVTYPYDKEDLYYIKSYRMRTAHRLFCAYRILADRLSRKRLKKYVNYIVTFSKDCKIFGIETIRTSNGVNVEVVPVSNRKQESDNINLIGVGTIGKHHGFDRVISGIKNYNDNIKINSINIIFHIVGEGEDLDSLKRLVHSLNLKNHIVFHGYKTGKDLDEVFDICDLGIGSIGRHRNEIYQLADLKSREYCARGMPFVKTVTDYDFEDFKYCLTIKANDDPVDILELIEFITTIKDENYKLVMREYARKRLTWEAKLSLIMQKIVGN